MAAVFYETRLISHSRERRRDAQASRGICSKCQKVVAMPNEAEVGTLFPQVSVQACRRDSRSSKHNSIFNLPSKSTCGIHSNPANSSNPLYQVVPIKRRKLLPMPETQGYKSGVQCHDGPDPVLCVEFIFSAFSLCTLYIKSTMTSFSCIPRPLKCFRTVPASCSFVCRLVCRLRFMVGEYMPMPPGFDRTHWWYVLTNEAGAVRRCSRR